MTEKKLIHSPLNDTRSATEECIFPPIGEFLTAYAVNLLNESLAQVVEDHLLACLSCREEFLKMSKIFGPGQDSDYRDFYEGKKRTGESNNLRLVKSAGDQQ